MLRLTAVPAPASDVFSRFFPFSPTVPVVSRCSASRSAYQSVSPVIRLFPAFEIPGQFPFRRNGRAGATVERLVIGKDIGIIHVMARQRHDNRKEKAMGQQQYEHDSQNGVGDASSEHIEEIILAALRLRNLSVGQTVNISQLQEDCSSIGYSPRELSQGLVRLLMRQYLSPCGELSFMLTQEGHRAGERALLARYGD
jgi:hypothetical protein